MRRIRITMIVSLLALTVPLTGCFYSMPERDPQKPVPLEKKYQASFKATDTQIDHKISINTGWWTLYDDQELNRLIAQAIANSPSINQIRARLEQARAIASQNRSALLPSLNVSGDRSTFNGQDSQNSNLSISNGNIIRPSDFTISGAASYELDFWGENQANFKAGRLNETASQHDLYAALITLSASVVEGWLNILSLLEQERLIRKQIATNQTVLDLQYRRFEFGTSRALDILQQKEILASTQAALPDVISAREQALNNLSALIGETPGYDLHITEQNFPKVVPLPETGLPSDLLNNRPDIVAAWNRLESSDWATKVAWADRLPQFSLSASYVTNVTSFNKLFQDWLLTMVAEFTGPIFDGGRRKAVQNQQAAIADENYHNYREVVLNAVTDVENALIENRYQDERLNALQQQLNASKKTLEQAQLRYINGDADYINVLSSLNNTQSLEQQIKTEKLEQARARVGLYRTLGGGVWVENMAATHLYKPFETADIGK